MTEVRVLHRPMYSEAEAARLLRVPQSTLHWWLDGGTIGGRTYPPVIRKEPTGSRQVTWGEFVEAGLLRQYRRELLVSLANSGPPRGGARSRHRLKEIRDLTK
jgi:hypothetical protein